MSLRLHTRRPARRQRRRGFTLIELMVVVAIIGILASIAVPVLLRLQMRARTAEVGANLAAIRTAQTSWFAELGSYVSASPSPATHGGASRQTFVDTGGGFTNLGWKPEGQVYFNYAVATSGAAYTADAAADLDEDGAIQVWGYVHPDGLGTTVAGALSCAGVYDPTSGLATSTDLVGPCDATYGRSEF